MKKISCLLFAYTLICITKLFAQPSTVSPCDYLIGEINPSGIIFSSPEFSDSILSWTSYDDNGTILAIDTIAPTHIVPLSFPLSEGYSFTICAEYWLSNWDWDGMAWCCVNMTWENGTLVGNPVQPLATDNHESLSVFSYPNPASNNLTVDLGDFNGVNTIIKIYDSSRKLIFMQQSTSTLIIDVSSFNKGMYLLEISTNEQVLRSKLIID